MSKKWYGALSWAGGGIAVGSILIGSLVAHSYPLVVLGLLLSTAYSIYNMTCVGDK